MSYALIIVGMQYDHLPGGVLPVAESGDILIEIREQIVRAKQLEVENQEVNPIIAVREWHPDNHFTFELPYDGHEAYPPHCVEGTKGGRLHTSVSKYADYVVSMGMNRNEEAYSAFQGKTLRPVHSLEEILQIERVDTVVVCGIRFAVEVKHTALDANAIGYRTVIPPLATDFDYAVSEDLRKRGIQVGAE
jgi:nicotinamidase/pyrazinamidase